MYSSSCIPMLFACPSSCAQLVYNSATRCQEKKEHQRKKKDSAAQVVKRKQEQFFSSQLVAVFRGVLMSSDDTCPRLGHDALTSSEDKISPSAAVCDFTWRSRFRCRRARSFALLYLLKISSSSSSSLSGEQNCRVKTLYNLRHLKANNIHS